LEVDDGDDDDYDNMETIDIDPKELVLGEDYYSLAYISYLIHNQNKYSLTREIRNTHFKRCLYIFGLQIVLVALLGLQMVSKDFKFTLANYQVLLARFICAILLHIQLNKEVFQAIGMIKHVANNYE
jgi:hypothetical protein